MGKLVPDREFLIGMLNYDPASGALVWRKRGNIHFDPQHAGKPAGSLTAGRADGSNRYLAVGIKTDRYRQYQAHRLIWMIVTGEQPPDQIDHRDGDELNLKWDNLRAATHGQNIQNSKLRKDNKTGFKGVSLRVKGKYRRYRAQISVNRRLIIIGDFKSPEAAGAARAAAAIKLHGEFARLK